MSLRLSYRAVMFDLDGTLADTLADLANATNHALVTLGCPTHPVDAYRHMVGDGARVLCERALPANRQDLTDRALDLMRSHYQEHRYDQTVLYPGITELVATLRAKELKLAVLSNKPDPFTREMITRYFPAPVFDVVRGHLPPTPLKPDPTSAIHIADQLGISPTEWLYLGDTNTDMQTAKAAGMYAVGVLWGFRDQQELVASGANVVIKAPSEVLKLV